MTTHSFALGSGLLTVQDSQIMQLLNGGTSEKRVVDIGVWRRSWTAEDVARVIRDYRTPGAKADGSRSASPKLVDVSDSDQWLPPVFADRPSVVIVTPAQARVLTALCEGLPDREIAERLCVAEETVKSHVKNIYSLLQVNKRILAAARVLTGRVVVQVQNRSGRRSA